MTLVESHYFALMRAALWQQPVALEGKPDWEGIMRVARHHATEVLVADVASRLTGDARPSEEMLRQMKKAMYGNLISQQELKRILLKAMKALETQGIEFVLLKGFGLARLYPNPSLRQFGDIDLFVGLQQYHQACMVLRGLSGGYNWGDEIEVGRHYNIEFGRFPMEVHRMSAEVNDAKEQAVYAAIEQDGLVEHRQNVDFGDCSLPLPSNEFMVFFTFFHFWDHFMTSGVGWRQLSDVAMTLHSYHGQLDVDKLHDWLVSMHLMGPWQAFGGLMETCLGLPVAEIPFYKSISRYRTKQIYDRIMVDGNFRRFKRYRQYQPKGILIRKIYAIISVFLDFFGLVGLFPKHAFRMMSTTLTESISKNFQKK